MFRDKHGEEKRSEQGRAVYVAAIILLCFAITVYAFFSGHISLVSPMNVFSVIRYQPQDIKTQGRAFWRGYILRPGLTW